MNQLTIINESHPAPVKAEKIKFDYDALVIIALACHETAHLIQHYMLFNHNKLNTSWKAGIFRKPHGKGFRRIYAHLRAEFVNPYIRGEREYRPIFLFDPMLQGGEKD